MKKTPLKRGTSTLKSKSTLKRSHFKGKKYVSKEGLSMMDWFRTEIWDKRCDTQGNCRCFETGKLMHRDYYRDNASIYHHLKTKSAHPDKAFDPDNIVIILPEIHAQVHNDINKCVKIKQKTDDYIFKGRG